LRPRQPAIAARCQDDAALDSRATATAEEETNGRQSRGAGAHALRRHDRADAALVLRKTDLADGAGGHRATPGGGAETLHGLRGLGVLPRPAATNLGQRARPSLPPAGNDRGATGLLEEAMRWLCNRLRMDSPQPGQKRDSPREARAGPEVLCRTSATRRPARGCGKRQRGTNRRLPAIIAGNRVDTLVTPHGIWPATLQPPISPDARPACPRIRSKYRAMVARTSSGSCSAPSAVDPTVSANRTETSFRSSGMRRVYESGRSN